MDTFYNPLTLSRLQFAITTSFHMFWPLLTIGLAWWLVALEAAWMITGRETFYRHRHFWGKLFLLGFGVGVASGLPLEFQFGTNWALFSRAGGGFFGNILGFEASMSFMLEAAFLGIMIFGWNRISKGMHLFATIMVAFGATLSAFWIMSANAWMQTPAGTEMVDGRAVPVDYYAAIFNPSWFYSFTHMLAACLATTLFFIGGICAWFISTGRQSETFLKALKGVVLAAAIITPLQIYLGDLSGRGVAKYQPAKTAAMEAHWQTNAPGSGASWAVAAWPDSANERNAWEIRVPYMLSLMTDRSLTGPVTGLKEFPPRDRPPVALPFYALRLMVLIGMSMFALMLWSLAKWARGRLTVERLGKSRWFLRAWMWSIPLGFIAADLGWAVREVGRQPWVIYNVMRTEHGVSNISAANAAWTLVGYTAIYIAILIAFIVLARRVILRGPDETLELSYTAGGGDDDAAAGGH
ncbi:MAG: cytochrome ubiquinol oxidase subunit I [Planctomycetaceae bacterium]|nr:cytochrome ubiquinol oxidase subunit I [Planctomycetaceae bacterium]